MKKNMLFVFVVMMVVSTFSAFGATVTNVLLNYTPTAPSPDNDLLVGYSLNLEGSESAAKAVFDWKKASVSLAKLNMPFELQSCGGGTCTTKDYSSNGNTGTNNGATWLYNSGYDSWGVYDFDGSNDYVQISHSSSLDLNHFTLEARVNTDVVGGGSYHAVISKHNSPNRPPSLWLAPTGKVEVWISSSAVATSVSTLSTGTWYHLAATYDGSNIKIYINGVLDKTVAYSTAPPTNTQPLFIGQRGDNTNYWNGKIDEVRVYNFALSADQVADHNGGNPDDRMEAAETASDNLWKVTLSPIGRTGTSHAEGTSVTSNQLKIPYLLTACKTSGWVAGGIYMLQNDVTTSGNCMVIDANDVELNCQGHVLDGDDSGISDYGVHVNGNLDNIKVNGCTIQDFTNGLHVIGGGAATKADNLKFENNLVQSNTRYGAFADYTNNALFSGNTFTSLTAFYANLQLDDDNDNTVVSGNTFNQATQGTTGLYVDATDNGNLIVNDNIFNGAGGSSHDGLRLYDADGATVHHNVFQNYLYGVYLSNDADNNVFYNNDFKTNSGRHAKRANGLSTGNVFDSGGVGNYWDDFDTVPEGCLDTTPADGECDGDYDTGVIYGEANPIVDTHPWTTAQN